MMSPSPDTHGQWTPLRPVPDAKHPLFRDYFEGLREGRLLVRECLSCFSLQWPPRDMCGECHQSRFGSKEIPHAGHVYTFTIVYRAFQPWFEDKVPYALVIAQMNAGVRLMGNYWDEDMEQLECGQAVDANFEDVSPNLTLLAWTRQESSGRDDRGG